MTPKLSRIWIADRRDQSIAVVANDALSIRIDFDNDRHYEARIAYPYDREAVARALHDMAGIIGHDPLLAKS